MRNWSSRDRSSSTAVEHACPAARRPCTWRRGRAARCRAPDPATDPRAPLPSRRSRPRRRSPNSCCSAISSLSRRAGSVLGAQRIVARRRDARERGDFVQDGDGVVDVLLAIERIPRPLAGEVAPLRQLPRRVAQPIDRAVVAAERRAPQRPPHALRRIRQLLLQPSSERVVEQPRRRRLGEHFEQRIDAASTGRSRSRSAQKPWMVLMCASSSCVSASSSRCAPRRLVLAPSCARDRAARAAAASVRRRPSR